MSYRGGGDGYGGRRDDRGSRDYNRAPRQWQGGDRRQEYARGPDQRGRGGGYQDRRGGGYAGHKRGRDDDRPPPDPKRELITRLLRLGEPKDSRDAPEDTIMQAVTALRREIDRQTPELDEVMIEAVCGAAIKTTQLALVTGLVRLWQREWVDALVARAVEAASAALEAGGPGRDRARLLVRWLACLVAPGVVTGSSAAQLLEDLLAAAKTAAAERAAADGSGASWQPWSDHLAYCAIAALPWAGGDIATSAPNGLAAVGAAAEAYLAARPCSFDAALAPFAPGSLPEGDPGARADSGGASFLGELWAAVRACQDKAGWQVESIPHGLMSAFAQQLARGAHGDDEGAPPPMDLPRIAVPNGPPSAAVASPAALRAAYPPRGGLVLLPRDKVEGGRPAVERFVQEEYIFDSVTAYDGHRVDLATLLVSRLPLPYDHVGVLIETLLGAMARLPAPVLRPVAYHTLLMDVCKLARESPKYMAAWVRAAYDRMGALDPEIRGRVADYLAHHLSNFQWLWSWERWDAVLTQPTGSPQRAFCVDVLQRMVGLSYWEHLKDGWAQAVDPETRETKPIKKFLPVEWEPLLGPKPEIPPLPGTEPPAQQQQQDAEMQEQEQQQNNGEGDGDGASKNEQQQPQQQAEPPEVLTPELEWAGKLLALLRTRKPTAAPGGQGAPQSADDVRQWLEEFGARSDLGSPEAVVCVVARAVLAAGAKTPTHLGVMTDRYGGLLQQLVADADAAGGDAGSRALLDAVVAGYGRHPERMVLAVDRLQGAGVVSAAAVVAWAMAWDWLQLGPPAEPRRAGAAAALLRGALAAAIAAEGGAHEEAARQGAAVREAEQQLTAAAEEVARARERDAAAAGAAEGAAPRASARVDFALRAEAVAAGKLEAARAELERLEAAVAAAGPALHAALLALYRGLASRLLGAGGDADMEGEGAEARQEELSQARALARWLALPSQPVAGEVAAVFAEAPEDLRQAVLGQLGLAQG